MISRLAYRRDIDGLRAVAVLAVVAFHAFPGTLKGGFTGVDVFFAISGFLISTLIFENLDEGRFGLAEFYARRIQRLFPALILVLAASCALGWFVLLADEFKQLGKHVAAGAAFVSNIVLWREAGYFDAAAETKPLLHLWSLGIEEQFYLVWPLLLWQACKRHLPVGTILALVVLASFLLNAIRMGQEPAGAFYSLQTRLWELASGGLLAWLTLRRQRLVPEGAPIANALSFLGLGTVACGFLLIDKDMGYPGGWALVPAAGTLLVVAAGPRAWANAALLSGRPAVWLGLVSYPLYLWHWPLLVFARIVEGEPPDWRVRAAIVVLAVGLAALTYRLVELPVRRGGAGKRKAIALVVPMVAVGAAGLVVQGKDGFGFRDGERQAFIEYFDNSIPAWRYATVHDIFEAYRTDCDFYDYEAYRHSRATKVPIASIGRSCHERDLGKRHAVLLWGDSHAQQLRFGLDRNLPGDWQVLQVTTTGCVVGIGASDSATDHCARSNFVALRTIAATRPDVVLVSQFSVLSAAQALTIKTRLLELGVAKVVFVGPVPRWTADLPKIVARQLWLFTPERTFVGLDRNVFAQNRRMKEAFAAEGLTFVDVLPVFCTDKGCLTRIGPDRLADITTHDRGHLLPVASDYLAARLLVSAIVGR